ncbi:hypothetical protein [Streptomyces sp. T21Q-yed]|uniref:hypothetical protein n=1 Tax=Streptomyces sp. T21Q-yed TaxID=3018441 RepID=UPI0023DE732A|nr:hypothetical protein [Streptomyces sp. T21Q-yed]
MTVDLDGVLVIAHSHKQDAAPTWKRTYGRHRRGRRTLIRTDSSYSVGMVILDGRPPGMRLIVRKERPHPGAQLRLTDADGMRLTDQNLPVVKPCHQ